MLNLKRGDTAVGLSFTIMDKAYKGLNFSNAVLKFILINENNETIVSRDCQIDDPINGKVSFYFNANEINIAGNMRGELEVIYSDGLIETFPNGGYIPILVNDRLVPFTPPKDSTPPIVSATPAGMFNSFVTIELNANESSVIYYTLDGSNPNETSLIYTKPVDIFETKTLKFFGKDMFGNKSNIQTAIYTITNIIINGGMFTNSLYSQVLNGGTFLFTPTDTVTGGTFTNGSGELDGGTFIDNSTDTLDGGTF